MAESTHDWGKHKKSYLIVFGALCACTCLTLALGIFAPFDLGPPGPTPADFVIGLAVACFKASLVGLIFMHLNHERGLIYKLLVFTFLFSLGLMALTLFAGADPILEQYDTLESTNGKLMEKL
ncbi:cytochrome C oxidase subunit IV family protein [Verrucomicrobiales bacterium BCK34]|nr:cytochrome C oxidase subunit IV family protein [Verrucomicrobiales bacterium BCK34]